MPWRIVASIVPMKPLPEAKTRPLRQHLPPLQCVTLVVLFMLERVLNAAVERYGNQLWWSCVVVGGDDDGQTRRSLKHRGR